MSKIVNGLYECPRCRTPLKASLEPNILAGGNHSLGETLYLRCVGCDWSWQGPEGSEPAKKRTEDSIKVHVPYTGNI